MKKFLLDTNASIALLDGDPRIATLVHEAIEGNCSLSYSAVTISELVVKMTDEEIAQSGIIQRGDILDVTKSIALMAGKLRSSFLSSGRKLKTPDALIMATAIYYMVTH